jgi:hypothetical protein
MSMRFNNAEVTGQTNRRLMEATLFQQNAVLLFGPLTPAWPTKHI